MLRYGYKRVTIDDIAARAEVGKGTIYLHRRMREDLFGTLLLREALAVWHELLRRVREDPTEVRFSRMMRSMMLVGMRRPLSRALFTRDREVLGKLAESGFGAAVPAQEAIAPEEPLLSLRRLGFLRADTDLTAQRYALRATVTGFLARAPSHEAGDQLSLEDKADALAETIRRAFEPEVLPSPDALEEEASRLIQWLEQVIATFERQLK